MKNANIGIVNFIISNKLKDSYFNNNLIDESKKLTYDFMDVVKSSPILQLEFKTFDNIENKHIENELIASRYIDTNIKLFEVYTLQEIEREHLKLNAFINEETIPIDDDKILLYNAIETLIKESLNDYDKVNVDNIHESFIYVLNHLKQPKISLVENVTIDELDEINEDVIEIAVDNYNEKYKSLNEDEKTLLQKLIKSNDKEKRELLESYKTENLSLLENINKEGVKDNIAKAIQKIKEMKYSKKNVDNDIISLHELKKELL